MVSATSSILAHGAHPVSAITAITPDPVQELADKVRASLHRCWVFRAAGCWKRELATLSPETLGRVIEQICQEEDSLSSLEKLAAILPMEQLEAAVRLRYPEHTDALKAASDMLKEAECYLRAEENAHLSPTLKVRLKKILEYFCVFLETILEGLGVATLFKSSETDIHSEFKTQKIMTLFSMFSMFSAMLIPVLGAALAAWVIGGTLLGIAALSILYQAVKPAPVQLPLGENWTRLHQEGKLHPVQGRKAVLDSIARTLLASQQVKTHPLLIGKTGVGKTETIKAFVQAIERGDYGPELQGKQVIYFNTARLVQHQDMFGGGNRILHRISEMMGRHRDKYLLVFDEIHYALKEKEHSALGEELKTMLDPGSSSLPHVIGITTEEEYYRDIYVNHAAFARRFHPIPVQDPSHEETLEILNNAFLVHGQGALKEPNALSELLRKTKTEYPQAPQPLTALKILTKCIQATSHVQSSSREQQVETIRTSIASIYAQGATLMPHQMAQKTREAQQLEIQLQNLEAQLSQEKQAIAKVFGRKEQCVLLKKRLMEEVVKVRRSFNLALFLLLGYFKAPQMEQQLRGEAERLHLSLMIDDKLIDRMIAEQKTSDQCLQEARQRGHADLAARVDSATISA